MVETRPSPENQLNPTVIGKPGQKLTPPVRKHSVKHTSDLGPNCNEEITQDNRSDGYRVERIVKSGLIGRKLHFMIKWKGYKKCTWEPKENVPDELIRDYYIRKSRKNKSKK